MARAVAQLSKKFLFLNGSRKAIIVFIEAATVPFHELRRRAS
jgi:hypothetical protein